LEELTFSVDSALLNELGERLVESVHIALLELVKNSYDADATIVTVSFGEDDSGRFRVVVRDNGTGMTFDEVQRYWMRIATTSKVTDSVSAIFGRPKSGSKGIGRFSCRRLGNSLRLSTIAEALGTKDVTYEKTEVFFEWNNFKPGTEVTKIKCPGTRESLPEAETGTTLVITGSNRWEWGLRAYSVLKRQLAVLVANRGAKRSGFRDDPGFTIKLEAPDFAVEPRDLREDLINAGWGTITADITSDGKASCNLVAMGLDKRNAIGQKSYKHLSGVSLKIGIFVSKQDEIRDKSVLSKGTMSEILNEWGGIQVKHNGVRIYPYGDDDWLRIDADRGRRLGASSNNELQAFAESLEGVDPGRVLLSLLSHKSYLGTVYIDSKDEGFQPKVNREGFRQSEAVDELNHFVRYCIDWTTIYRDFWIRQRNKAKAEEALKEFEQAAGIETSRADVIRAAAVYIKGQFERIITAPTENEREQVARAITPSIKAILENDQANENELRHLRLIASSSILLLIFSHEVKSFLSDIDNTEGIVDNMLRFPSKEPKLDLERLKAQLSKSKTRFEQLLQMTALVGVDARKSKPARLSLRDRVETAVSCFALVINAYDVNVDYSQIALTTIVGPIMEAELYAILLNALSNALKSVIAAGKTKKISITAKRSENRTKIIISDTGLGLNSSRFQEVFIPFIADPEGNLYSHLDDRLNPADKYIVGTGSGLGLSIVKEIVTSRGGSVRFLEPEKPWNAQLEVLLP